MPKANLPVLCINIVPRQPQGGGGPRWNGKCQGFQSLHRLSLFILQKEDAKVKAYTAEFGATECRSPERVFVWKDLLVKLLRRLGPVDIEALSHGLREGSGLDAAQGNVPGRFWQT